jgi:hypothetical protein
MTMLVSATHGQIHGEPARGRHARAPSIVIPAESIILAYSQAVMPAKAGIQ